MGMGTCSLQSWVCPPSTCDCTGKIVPVQPRHMKNLCWVAKLPPLRSSYQKPHSFATHILICASRTVQRYSSTLRLISSRWDRARRWRCRGASACSGRAGRDRSPRALRLAISSSAHNFGKSCQILAKRWRSIQTRQNSEKSIEIQLNPIESQ